MADLNPDMNYRFTDEELAALTPYGAVEHVDAGAVLFADGVTDAPLCVVLSGQLDIVFAGPEQGVQLLVDIRQIGMFEPEEAHGEPLDPVHVEDLHSTQVVLQFLARARQEDHAAHDVHVHDGIRANVRLEDFGHLRWGDVLERHGADCETANEIDTAHFRDEMPGNRLIDRQYVVSAFMEDERRSVPPQQQLENRHELLAGHWPGGSERHLATDTGTDHEGFLEHLTENGVVGALHPIGPGQRCPSEKRECSDG